MSVFVIIIIIIICEHC